MTSCELRISGWSSDVCSSDLASGMPHLLRHLDAARELFPLVVLGELIAVGGGGEAALVAEGTLLQRHVARGLVDALSQIVPAFHRRPLGAYEAEHPALTLRHAERSDERRVGQGVVMTCESRWVTDN